MICIPAILFVLTIMILLIVIGKPVGIEYKTNGFLDSFEKTDYDRDGRIKQDYLAWNGTEHSIKINYRVFYKWEKNPLNRKNKISVKLENIKLPEDFQILLKRDNNDYYEYSYDRVLELVNETSFLIKISQIDNYIDLTQPQTIKFTINLIVLDTKVRERIKYEFLIGEDLGENRVAFDPGTTATTIAFGNDNHNISILKNKKGNRITPSVLVFDKANIENSFYGEDAESRIKTTGKYTGFRSIKKLLGYKDKNADVNKNGKELAAKLVQDIYKDIVQVEANRDLGIERAKRAVVAIPNNYTATKIKDMLFCIESLKQFKEIRCVYEAEAVLFYYLSNKSDLNEKFDCNNTKENETILVVDMGGATINATVAQINKRNKDIYEVTVLSKTGYGIGGDSIDYCILKSIFDFSADITELQKINIFDEPVRTKLSEQDYNRIKEDLIELSLKMKKKIIENQKKTELISANDLQIYLTEAVHENISIDIESDFYRIFKTNSKYCILRNNHFNSLIYNSVSDATKEVIKIAGNRKIDKIILSGRSSSFPKIETSIMNAFSYSADIIDLNKIGTAKTAVAEGACWYGVNNNCIKLNNLKTAANFGFVKTLSPDKTNIRFVDLINAGQDFTSREHGNKSVEKTTDCRDRFSFDGNRVNFYQVMGSDAKNIIAGNEKHKFSKIATVRLQQESEKIGMKVNENDDVTCSVKLVSGSVIKERGVVADQEITDANEEHYTWMIN
jgi:hypothetical protein